MNEENGVLLADLAAHRARIRELRREAFRSRSFGRWLKLIIHDQAGTFSGHHLWRHHPAVRSGSELTFGERAADVMRNAFGSWTFVGGFLTFMALWMIVNTVLLGTQGWDHYPYILLNLALSMMAGLQGALILIAAKRSDRVAAEQAIAHYTETSKLDTLMVVNNEMTERIESATGLLEEIHRHVSGLAGQFSPGQECSSGTCPAGEAGG